MNQNTRLNSFDVQRAVDEIVQSFPSTYVEVTRATKYTDSERQVRLSHTVIFKGEALLVPASADLVRAPLGEISSFALVILIAGRYDIRQKDFVRRYDILYQIDFPPAWLGGFMGLKLKRYEQ